MPLPLTLPWLLAARTTASKGAASKCASRLEGLDGTAGKARGLALQRGSASSSSSLVLARQLT